MIIRCTKDVPYGSAYYGIKDKVFNVVEFRKWPRIEVFVIHANKKLLLTSPYFEVLPTITYSMVDTSTGVITKHETVLYTKSQAEKYVKHILSREEKFYNYFDFKYQDKPINIAALGLQSAKS